MLYGVVPIDSKVAAALGAVVALLVVALVAVIATWRISITRNRKAYKKWNEEVCRCRAASLTILHAVRKHMVTQSMRGLSGALASSDVWSQWVACRSGVQIPYCSLLAMSLIPVFDCACRLAR